MVPIEYGKALMGTQMYGEKLAHENSSIIILMDLDILKIMLSTIVLHQCSMNELFRGMLICVPCSK